MTAFAALPSLPQPPPASGASGLCLALGVIVWLGVFLALAAGRRRDGPRPPGEGPEPSAPVGP